MELTYDGIGNPLTYYNGSRYTMSWMEGRKLQNVARNGIVTSYQYDSSGMRTKKLNADGSYTCYYPVNGQTMGETRHDRNGNTLLRMRYVFDELGSAIGLSLWYNGDTGWSDYYFLKSLQGDILQIYRASDNTLMAEYSYDSWGNILSATGALADVNPFRYRGYYYDAETGFYYVSSRYYDPEVGRFISADSAISGVGGDIRGYNMYSYCFNNPVNMSDPTGDWPKWVETAAKVVSVVAVVAAVAVTVAAVSAVSAGTGTAAAVFGASIFLGAALSGINGAVANSKKGNSYLNGYVGGATGGAIQAACSKTYAGTIVGGSAGVTVGTAITDTLNNWDPDSQNTTREQMIENATTSGLKALVTSSVTAYAGYSADLAQLDGAGGLMPSFTYGFAEGFKAFFGWADDAVIYVWE